MSSSPPCYPPWRDGHGRPTLTSSDGESAGFLFIVDTHDTCDSSTGSQRPLVEDRCLGAWRGVWGHGQRHPMAGRPRGVLQESRAFCPFPAGTLQLPSDGHASVPALTVSVGDRAARGLAARRSGSCQCWGRGCPWLPGLATRDSAKYRAAHTAASTMRRSWPILARPAATAPLGPGSRNRVGMAPEAKAGPVGGWQGQHVGFRCLGPLPCPVA